MISRSPHVSRYSLALMITLVAGVYGGWLAWAEQRTRTYPLDLDGWGHYVLRLKESQHQFASLFLDPPLWKGPILPFIYGLCYYLAPFDESVLVLNVLAFACAGGVLFLTFTSLGASSRSAFIAILLWIFFPPNRGLFGYYYAEPFLSLLVALLFLITAKAIQRRSALLALATGGVAGVLVLARAPFLLVVACLPIVFWCYLGATRKRSVLLFVLGFMLAWAPWCVRNFIVYREFIPFTTDGGLVLFQGSYLLGDSCDISYLRQLPEFVEMEAKAKGTHAVDQYRYWRSLALEQIGQDPLAQVSLCIRKAMRFWMYVPPHSWIPAWKTGLAALILLPLAFYGILTGRRSLLVQMCALWVGGLWAFHALIHAELRYNFPILPMAFLLAVIGAQHLLSGDKRPVTQPVDGLPGARTVPAP